MPGTVSVLPTLSYLKLIIAVGSRDYHIHFVYEETELREIKTPAKITRA